ncbi:hypothetical protein [Acidianus infernus]|uniref:hypothetical protein n=1 Tax=Acidianus infernus TaxID=12915 RepID=UPI0035940535
MKVAKAPNALMLELGFVRAFPVPNPASARNKYAIMYSVGVVFVASESSFIK